MFYGIDFNNVPNPNWNSGLRGDAAFWAIISAQNIDWIESCYWDSVAIGQTFDLIYN